MADVCLSLSYKPAQLWGYLSLSFLYLKGQTSALYPRSCPEDLRWLRMSGVGYSTWHRGRGTGEASPEEKPAGWRLKVC